METQNKSTLKPDKNRLYTSMLVERISIIDYSSCWRCEFGWNSLWVLQLKIIRHDLLFLKILVLSMTKFLIYFLGRSLLLFIVPVIAKP